MGLGLEVEDCGLQSRETVWPEMHEATTSQRAFLEPLMQVIPYTKHKAPTPESLQIA